MDIKEYINVTEKKVGELVGKMDVIQKKVTELAHDDKVEARKSLKLFYERLPIGYQHLEALKSAAESEAEKIKNDIQSVIGELEAALEKATADTEDS